MTRRAELASLVVTTHGTETAYTEQCLERIAAFKNAGPEVVVVVHDASALLGDYLEWCRERGVVDKLVYAAPGHGHLRGVNLGISRASRPVLVNVNIDVETSLYLVDWCVRTLLDNPHVGLVGWHYNWGAFHHGTRWNGSSLEYKIRYEDHLSEKRGEVDEGHRRNIRRAWWYTGRTLEAAGSDRLLLCNTSFFAIRRAVWRHIGGFDWHAYSHTWADDFMCYALLDQGYDVMNLPQEVTRNRSPGLFNCRSDLEWEGKSDPLRGRDHLATVVLPAGRGRRDGRPDGEQSGEVDSTETSLDRFPRPIVIVAPREERSVTELAALLLRHPHVAASVAPSLDERLSRREFFARLYADLPAGRRAVLLTSGETGLSLLERLSPEVDPLLLIPEDPALSSGRAERVRSPALLIKYQDDKTTSIRKMLEACGLDPEIYDYESLHTVPVRAPANPDSLES